MKQLLPELQWRSYAHYLKRMKISEKNIKDKEPVAIETKKQIVKREWAVRSIPIEKTVGTDAQFLTPRDRID